jgi:type IV fimbrial biogenesis protein FimT
MRAMGRGAAVLVRFDASSNPEGSLTVQEAVRGSAVTDANCKRLPSSSCTLTDWTTPTGNTVTGNVLVSSFAPPAQGQYQDTYITLQGDAAHSGAQQQMDLCFTPLGRAFVRYSQTGTFTPLAGVPVAEVYRKTGSAISGLIRTVMILPNGSTRLGTAKVGP